MRLHVFALMFAACAACDPAYGPSPATLSYVPGDAGVWIDGGLPPTPAEIMCRRFTMDMSALAEAQWSGNSAACDAGNLNEPGRTSIVRHVNLIRFLGGLPEVSDDPVLNARAQSCSLLMAVNGKLSHAPTPEWKCWTQEGAQAAGKSNLSTTPGVQAVQDYMIDHGNQTTLGHRRWLLSNSLGPIGVGSSNSASCLWVIGGKGAVKKAWQAWPPPGVFPYEAYRTKWSNLDVTGWSLQSDSVNLQKATVTVTEDGLPRPTTVTVLKHNYGSKHAISFVPKGWQAKAGRTYHVQIGGIAPAISYDVAMVICR